MPPPLNPKLSVGAMLSGLAQDLLRTLLRALVWLVALFLLGASVSAGICWHYGLPLMFSMYGGLGLVAVALGVFFALQAF